MEIIKEFNTIKELKTALDLIELIPNIEEGFHLLVDGRDGYQTIPTPKPLKLLRDRDGKIFLGIKD